MNIRIFEAHLIFTPSTGFEHINNDIEEWLSSNPQVKVLDIKTNVIYPGNDDIVCTATVIYE